jgi:hypothetical protein
MAVGAPAVISPASAASAAAPAAVYVLKHPRREHCRTHYARKVRQITAHVRGRRVRRRQTICARQLAPAPSPSANSSIVPAPIPGAPQVATTPRGVHLRAHIDPSFTQSTTNPLAVDYSFSASATSFSQADLAEAPEPDLPEGVLELYSDGQLACAIDVGGSASGGECPITYARPGAHSVVVTYLSGSTSATETSTEDVEPFTTTTTLSVETLECSEADHEYIEGKHAYHATNEWCSYKVSDQVVDQNGDTPPGEVLISARAQGAILEREFGFRGNPIILSFEREHVENSKPWRCRVRLGPAPLWPELESQYTVGSVEDCGATSELTGHYFSPENGWIGSDSAPVQTPF